jgi:hypothetical protein
MPVVRHRVVTRVTGSMVMGEGGNLISITRGAILPHGRRRTSPVHGRRRTSPVHVPLWRALLGAARARTSLARPAW